MQRGRSVLAAGAFAVFCTSLAVASAPFAIAAPAYDDNAILAQLRSSNPGTDVAVVLSVDGKVKQPLSEIAGAAAVAQAPARTPTPRPTTKPTPRPTAKPTPRPTAKPTPRPTVKPTPRPTVKPTPRPTAKPTPAATVAAALPTASPVAVLAPPTIRPVPTIAATPRPAPTAAPTPHPAPTAAPTPRPAPTPSPIVIPTVAPTAVPQPAPNPDALGFAEAEDDTFAATAEVAKPSNNPTPAPVHDLQWEYEHRFDTAKNDDDIPMPGIPIRSSASAVFGFDGGALHGVRTKNGYSAVRVTVTIPCGSAKFMKGPGTSYITHQPATIDVETGYIYIGGWGAGPNGVPVDAGLQKSSAQAAADEYGFYWKYGSHKAYTNDHYRFPCEVAPVTLSIYPVSPDLLVFSAHGITQDHVTRTLIAIQRTKPGDGWIPDGGSPNDGIVLKRIVSIAQDSSYQHARDRWTNGSYFGIDGPSDHPRPKIVFKSCEVGRVPPGRITAEFRPWTDADTWHPSSPNVYLDYPPGDVHEDRHQGCDAVGLYLKRGV